MLRLLVFRFLVVSIAPGLVISIGIKTLKGLDEYLERLDSADAEKAKAYVEHFLMRNEGQGLALPFSKAFSLPEWAEFMTCTPGECKVIGPASGTDSQRITQFEEAARSQMPCTDKVSTHSYQTMYGVNLLPFMEATNGAKLFEIGLGCDMNYRPGASVDLWKSLFPSATLWEAEFDAKCVQNAEANGLLAGVQVVTGDQGNQTTVQGWVAESGGDFDVVIDDGGHENKQIRASFEILWPHVKPGGMYFLEDLQVGRVVPWNDGSVVIADMVEAWVEQLLTQKPRADLPLPGGVQTIFCQAEACMLRKASR